MIQSHNLSRYSFLVLSMALFNPFLKSSTGFPSFCVVDILQLPSFIHFIDHFLRNLLAFLLIFPSKSIIVCNTHFLILFHHTSTFPHSHSISLSFYFWVSCTICYWACNFSNFSLGFPFWNLMIFFNLVVPILLMWSFHMKIHKNHSTNNYLIRHRDKNVLQVIFCKQNYKVRILS